MGVVFTKGDVVLESSLLLILFNVIIMAWICPPMLCITVPRGGSGGRGGGGGGCRAHSLCIVAPLALLPYLFSISKQKCIETHIMYRLYANKTEDLINERKFPSWNLCNSN